MEIVSQYDTRRLDETIIPLSDAVRFLKRNIDKLEYEDARLIEGMIRDLERVVDSIYDETNKTN